MTINPFIINKLIHSRYIALPALCMMLTACKVGPDYHKPDTALPKSWQSAPDNVNATGSIIQHELAWWQGLHDPVLNQLMVQAAAGNWDVKVAGARISEARSVHNAAVATLFPTGDLMASASRQANQIGFPSGAPDSLKSAIKQPFNIFKTGFDASWELDLFGGHRREAESAKDAWEASIISRDDSLISVLAEVAHSYIDIRQYQAQLQIAKDTLTTDHEICAITEQKLALGDTAGLDVAKAQAQQEHDRTQLPYYQNLLTQAEFSLDVLLGEPPGTAHKRVGVMAVIPVADKNIVLDAPAAVIAQRPDIRTAERKLAAATAQQGVALAKFFPDISLTGFVGLFNTNAGSFLTAGSKSWSMGGNLLWPILSYGSLAANLHATDAKQQEALAIYQKAIIAALSDVERSFSAYSQQERFRQILTKATDSDSSVYQIALGRYQVGLAAFLEVLDAQRRWYASQNQLALAKAQTAQDWVAVYKSLGGGWEIVKSHPPIP